MYRMDFMSVVCMCVFTLQFFPRAFCDHNIDHVDQLSTENATANYELTYNVDGLFDLDEFQAVTRFIDSQKQNGDQVGRNLTRAETVQLVDIWRERFRLEESVSFLFFLYSFSI